MNPFLRQAELFERIIVFALELSLAARGLFELGVKRLAHRPTEVLIDLLDGLARMAGQFPVINAVVARRIDLFAEAALKNCYILFVVCFSKLFILQANLFTRYKKEIYRFCN